MHLFVLSYCPLPSLWAAQENPGIGADLLQLQSEETGERMMFRGYEEPILCLSLTSQGTGELSFLLLFLSWEFLTSWPIYIILSGLIHQDK